MSQVLIISGDKYFLSQDNFNPNPFKEIESPFGFDLDRISLNARAFLFYLERYAKEKWESFMDYTHEFMSFDGERFVGVLRQGEISNIGISNHTVLVQERKMETGDVKKYLQFDDDVVYDVTSYPFLFIRCGQVFVPDRVNFSRTLKSGGRDYAFISWDAPACTPLKL